MFQVYFLITVACYEISKWCNWIYLYTNSCLKHERKRLEQVLFRVIANNTGVGAKTGFDIFLGDICSEDAETRTGLVKKRS